MNTNDGFATRSVSAGALTTAKTALLRAALMAVLFSSVAIQPVLAQTTGTAFCGTDMALTIKNFFTAIIDSLHGHNYDG